MNLDPIFNELVQRQNKVTAKLNDKEVELLSIEQDLTNALGVRFKEKASGVINRLRVDAGDNPLVMLNAAKMAAPRLQVNLKREGFWLILTLVIQYGDAGTPQSFTLVHERSIFSLLWFLQPLIKRFRSGAT